MFSKKSLVLPFLLFAVIFSLFFIFQKSDFLNKVKLRFYPSSISNIGGISSNLVVYYTFDEDSEMVANDFSGNNNTAIFINEPKLVDGKIGKAIQFDGIDDYLLSSDSVSLSSLEGSNEATISFWIKRIGNSSRYLSRWGTHRLFDIGGDTNFTLRSYWRYGGTGSGGLSIDHTCSPSTCPIPLNEWTHVAVIYKNPTSYIYINGQLRSEKSGNGGPLNTGVSDPLKIGSSLSSYANAVLDEIRIYNRALSTEEIQQLYMTASQQTTSNLQQPPPVNGACSLSLNNCSSGVFVDVPDTETNYLWQCQGQNGGTTVNCSFPKQTQQQDATSPLISNISILNITHNSATISWTTNEPATSQIEYGLTTSYGQQTQEITTLRTSHSVNLTNLQPNTTYSLRVKSRDSAGNLAVSSNYSFKTSQILGAGRTFIVSTDGLGDFTTIKACADIAGPGTICNVKAGTFNERVVVTGSGTASSPIVFKAEGRVELSQGFDVRGNYVTIQGFIFTGQAPTYSAMVRVLGDHSKIIDNTFTNPIIETDRSSNPIWVDGSYAYIANNLITKWPIGTAIIFGSKGKYNIAEKNIIRDNSDIDAFRIFGVGHVIRENTVVDIFDGPLANHIDFIQTFGNNGEVAYDILVEKNFVYNIQNGQIAQLSQDCGIQPSGSNSLSCDTTVDINPLVSSVSGNTIVSDGINLIQGAWGPTRWNNHILYFVNGSAYGKIYLILSHTNNSLTVTNLDGSIPNLINDGVRIGDKYAIRNRIGWWTFKNNVFANALQISNSLPYMTFTNNTFLNIPQIGTNNSLSRGFSFHNKIFNNVYMNPYQSAQLYGPPEEITKVFYADYNYASLGPTMNYGPKQSHRCTSEYTRFYFCETLFGKHGINGGDPLFQNPNNLLGPDGIAWTADDGLMPSKQSFLCGAGKDNVDIGAYSCGTTTDQKQINYYSISVSKTGSGLGTVTGGFINCGQFCVQTNIAEGTILTLTATPTQGSSFGGWSGLCTGTYLTCTLVVKSNGTITANFNIDSKPTYILSVSKVGEGKIISSLGIDCGTDCSETYAQNSIVSLTAIPSEVHVFTGWSGDCNGTSNVCTITINANKNVVANFSPSQIGKVYHVKKDGTGNFKTIQECANVANAGDTCLVYAGDYPEFVQTTKDGNSEESRITFQANGNVKVKGFRVKNKYITIDGFDISKYAIGLSPAHITIEPEGHYCIIKNNVIHDGIQLLSNNYYFNGTTKTITNPNGGFLRAGFEPGTKIYVASNINNWILNHDITRTIKSVTDTTITINDDETLYTEGPVLALIYATRVAKSGVDGITMIYSSQRGTPNNCVISQNTISNLAGSALTIAGSNHLIEKNTIEKMNGWFIITFYGSNNIFKYNHVKNSPRYYGFERPDRTAVHSEGQGSWDFVAPIIRSFGNTVVESINNVFEYNFFENLDNEFANVNSTSITYDNPKPTGKTIFRNNVFANIEMHGAFHRPETIFENNTFYKAAYDTSNPVFTISTTKDGNAEGSIVKNNVFVETNRNYTNSSTGSYNIMNVNNYYANYNFVAGAVAENFPPINGFKGKETNGINGGNPKFQNINNLAGNDNIPFTEDDGLIPLQGSFLCNKGENGNYIGAYRCKGEDASQQQTVFLTADLNNDNTVNSIDLGILMSYWGSTAKPKADLNQDGIVNSVDFGILLFQWGKRL